jgi:hypothetical protein
MGNKERIFLGVHINSRTPALVATKFIYRDRVNRAAGRRSAVMVFAEPPGQFHHDPRFTAVNRDSSIWTALSGPESSHSSTWILQKLMPARAAVGN